MSDVQLSPKTTFYTAIGLAAQAINSQGDTYQTGKALEALEEATLWWEANASSQTTFDTFTERAMRKGSGN